MAPALAFFEGGRVVLRCLRAAQVLHSLSLIDKAVLKSGAANSVNPGRSGGYGGAPMCEAFTPCTKTAFVEVHHFV
jgi:hypothetical protein